MTGLLVEWEELEQHRAGDCEGNPGEGDRSSSHISLITSSPNTIQHVAIRVNPHIEVWSENIMEPSYLLISKETVWLPDFLDIRQCQILDLICNREIQNHPVISDSGARYLHHSWSPAFL